MGWLLALLVAVVVTGLVLAARRQLAARRARELESRGHFRLSRRAADEDVTRLGEELTELHFETLTTELDPDMRTDYQRGLDSYEEAKALLHGAEREEDISSVTRAVEDGRFAMTCVLARRDGEELPDRRPPCFFNPAHGPARADVTWAPSGGVEREIPVCFRCSERLAADLTPDMRLVRFGNRYVPWFQAGPSYGPYAEGYYGRYARAGLAPDFIVTTMLAGGAAAAMMPPMPADWSGWGGASSWGDDGPGSTSFDWGGGLGFGGGFGEGGFDIGGGDGGGGGGGDS